MLEFHLYRVKVYPPAQRSLFGDMTPSQMLAAIIEEHPVKGLRKNKKWHIGNIDFFDDDGGIYFRLGRTTKSKLELYQNGNFIDEEFEASPYTHVILDIPLEICAIAKKSKLAPTVKGIANQFARLLRKSDFATTHHINFEIDEISDPQEFISYIQRAYEISKFWITFSRPNPFDSNKDFIQPMGNLLNATNGTAGKTDIKGGELNPETLEELSRSTASTGNNAGAVMQIEEGQRKVTKQLKGNPVVITQKHVDDVESRRTLLQMLKKRYNSIRGTINHNGN